MSVNTSQLVCACSEDAIGDAVWACSLVRVDTFKCFAHVGCSEEVLKASKEVV